ncbi:hypothetical protein WICPIJ_006944 [Wickerhamomyces pijperi]|uniref:Uncharacterized protein n=1 Tax=Wickerhamomyces pijperi TaxID=599730 RepID=A0A9P8Q2T5_WICPI|nr:hypothetical protein WICPIJ_006944 [Wickerhamomyces pijperi]
MKMSASAISLNGPPLAVSFMSHLMMFSCGMPALAHISTAPEPQRPKAPMIKTRGFLAPFLKATARSFLTSSTRADSELKGVTPGKSSESACVCLKAQSFKPKAAPANPA